MTGLVVEGLRFQGLGPLSFTIPAGECLALMGASGVGKTLLLRALADLDRHEGVVRLDGVESTEVPAHVWRTRVGMLPAESAWWSDILGEHFSTKVDLAPLGFAPDALEREVSRLSTGERQRLALARLLASEPQALLLDEPTASLDPDNAARVEGILEAYRARHEAPVLWVSHDIAQARRVASFVYELTPTGLRQAT